MELSPSRSLKRAFPTCPSPLSSNSHCRNLCGSCFFRLATSVRRHFRIGFDTCTITGLARFGDAPEISLEGCDAGRFSLFVSEKMEVYPCSYMVESGYSGIPINGSSLKEIWTNSDGFHRFRAKHAEVGCADCITPRQCLSGCPLFPQMNLCPRNCCSA